MRTGSATYDGIAIELLHIALFFSSINVRAYNDVSKMRVRRGKRGDFKRVNFSDVITGNSLLQFRVAVFPLYFSLRYSKMF